MNTDFLDPKNIDQWKDLFIETNDLYQKVKVANPVEIAEGEVLSLDQINSETLKAEKAMDELIIPKRRANRLKDVAERWKRNEINKGIREASKNREEYPNQLAQKAHGEEIAEEYFKLCELAKDLIEGIHDERSRLYMYKKSLIDIGHNTRLERKMESK